MRLYGIIWVGIVLAILGNIFNVWALYSVPLFFSLIGVVIVLVMASRSDPSYGEGSIITLSIMFLLLFGILRVLYVDNNATKTLMSSEVLRDVSFVDDNHIITYKVGMTETIFSDTQDAETYFKNKSAYMSRYSPNKNETYQENCYMANYRYTYENIYDKNDTYIECY